MPRSLVLLAVLAALSACTAEPTPPNAEKDQDALRIAAIERAAQVQPNPPARAVALFDIPASLANKRAHELAPDEIALVRRLQQDASDLDTQIGGRINDMLCNAAKFSADAFDRELDTLGELTVRKQQLNNIPTGDPPGEQAIKSWERLDRSAPGSDVDAALTRLARRMAARHACEPTVSSNKLPGVFRYEYAVEQIRRHQLTCEILPYEWLAEHWREQRDRVAQLRGYLGNEETSFVHREIVEQLGQSCETNDVQPIARVLGLCGWRKHPQELGELPSLPLPQDERMRFVAFKDAERSEAQTAALVGEVARKHLGRAPDAAVARLQRIGALKPHGYWLTPDKSRVIFSFARWNSPDDYLPRERTSDRLQHTNRVLIDATADHERIVAITGGFGQYDDGEIAELSDADHDGNVEAWMAATYGECDGEGLVPGKDCAIPIYYRLEQFGGDMGPFVEGPRPADTAPVKESELEGGRGSDLRGDCFTRFRAPDQSTDKR